VTVNDVRELLKEWAFWLNKDDGYSGVSSIHRLRTGGSSPQFGASLPHGVAIPARIENLMAALHGLRETEGRPGDAIHTVQELYLMDMTVGEYAEWAGLSRGEIAGRKQLAEAQILAWLLAKGQ
jgi:hypothetical protein